MSSRDQLSPFRSLRRITRISLIASVVLAGCASSVTPASVDDTPVDIVEADDPAPAVAPSTDNVDQDAPTSSAPPELTASFRGVTESEIRIGVAMLDATAFGVDRGDLEAKWQVVIDAVNDAGGVYGRELIPSYSTYPPVGSVAADEACLRLVENVEVFAFVGEARENTELCYTELHNTIAVNAIGISEESIDRSGGLLFTPESPPLRIQELAVAAFARADLIDGEAIWVHALGGKESLIEPVVAAIEAGGGEVVGTSVTVVDGGDIAASARDHDTMVERAIADGATAIYAIDYASLPVAGALVRAGADLTMLTTAGEAADFGNADVDLDLVDVRIASRESLDDMFDRDVNGVRECVDRFEAASGETVNVGDPDAEVKNLRATIRACQAIELFVTVATAAGPDLTNDNFQAAAETIGDFELTGAAAASLGPDKFAADDTPLDVRRWDTGTRSFVPVSN
jgi:hypothetical protein